jgi:hypothetical protein
MDLTIYVLGGLYGAVHAQMRVIFRLINLFCIEGSSIAVRTTEYMRETSTARG